MKISVYPTLNHVTNNIPVLKKGITSFRIIYIFDNQTIALSFGPII